MDKKRTAARAGLAAQVEAAERDLSGIRQALRRPLEAEVARGELTAPQMAVMQAVVRRHGICLKELSAAVCLAHSTVSGIVDRLERRGMIERRPDAADGRVCRIFPTAAVTKFVQEIPALTRGPLAAAMKRASEEERQVITGALRRLRELMEKG